MTHQKHTKLVRPDFGYFGRIEWAIMGTNCGNIQKLANALNRRLIEGNSHCKVAYIDADHQAGDTGEPLPYFKTYTDKINFHRFDTQGDISPFQFRSFFNDIDIVLINGNHFKGNRQLVVLDRKKFDSLNRKLDRLTHIDAFISLDTEGGVMPDFLKQHIKYWSDIPVFNIHDTDNLASFLMPKINIPPINALILVGGKSSRMGQDKSLIDYHGKPQWEFLSEMLSNSVHNSLTKAYTVRQDPYGEKGGNLAVFVSCRQEQASAFGDSQTIFDTFTDLGPYGAILSAFRENPNTAWLVIACDLPLLDAATIQWLIDNRQPSAIATTYRSPESEEGFPEPLITIWEPKSYPVLLQFLSQGISCPRKVLINSDTHIIDPLVSAALSNVNTPEEMKQIIGIKTE